MSMARVTSKLLKPSEARKKTNTTDDQVAVDDVEVAAVPKEKNIHAKLGRLNSLQRNVNAYMNSKSKNFAAVQAFVTASANAQLAQAAAAAAAQAAVDAQAKLDALNAQLDALNALTDEQIAAMTPEEQAGGVVDEEALGGGAVAARGHDHGGRATGDGAGVYLGRPGRRHR